MADELEDLPFDPTLKKKKKKKKPFDLEAALEGGEAASSSTTENHADDAGDANNDAAPSKTEPSAKPEEEDDDLNLDFGGLKKKKKKKKVLIETMETETATTTSETSAAADVDKDNVQQDEDDIMDDDLGLDLTGMKKKKKKKKPLDVAALENDLNDLNVDEDADAHDGLNGTEEVSDQISLTAWRPDSTRDYTYEELLARVFEIMRQKNPDMVAGEKKKFVMRPPQVVRAGAKKTSFVNFTEICRLLHRQPKHLMAFLMAELGTSGSVDGTNQLVIKGRFQQKQIENVLRRYIKEYVTCHTCRSPETMLQRDTRLYFLQCETCGSRCSVATIKSGFQAMTGKRAAIRAKAQ